MNSLQYGKKQTVTAIPKESDSSLIASYRPISITPPHQVRHKILAWLVRRNSIPPEQHGFLSGASTVTQLADCKKYNESSQESCFTDASLVPGTLFLAFQGLRGELKIKRVNIGFQAMSWPQHQAVPSYKSSDGYFQAKTLNSLFSEAEDGCSCSHLTFWKQAIYRPSKGG
ncbi:hypothetical protein COOONC_08400 [Cooperia oncophora]